LLFAGVCSLIGNSILLYISYKKKHLLKPAEFLIINLAVSDLGMTVTLYPLAITSAISHRWLFGKSICLFYAFCGVLFGICSLSTLTLLSTVCCVKVCFPVYGNRFRNEHGKMLIACAWAYAVVFACSPLVHWGEYGAEPYGTACCIDWKASNKEKVALSYTTALFVFCFVIPCGIIITSYTLILMTVKESRKAVQRHISAQTRMNNVQAIIVKLSVAVCIGFFAAWTPYAVVAMWAAFGSIEQIPPLAFAIPALFAKSSTLYNPITYLLLKPNFRNIVAKDFAVLQQLCVRTCFCLKALQNCSYRSVLEVTSKSLERRNKSSSYSVHTAEGSSHWCCEKCTDTFECFQNYPKCCQAKLNTVDFPQESTSQEPKQQTQERQSAKKSVKVIVRGQKSAEIDSLEITLEIIPAHFKCASL
ncbi:opsin 7, group member a, partial [Latimeria chalumnae]|uniref:opsin 7, group member a n=1 Tax=Latimeria chalumnae TaxID=7897 RepID=UPI00313E9348